MTFMTIATIAAGAVLCATGAAAFVLADGRTWTALIPAFVGLPVALCGVIALAEGARRHAIHAALGLTLLGLLGSAPGVVKAVAWLAGSAPERPLAVQVQTAMAVVCLAYLVLGIRSFIAARRARAAGG
ncbi:MAG: hypothetical protein RLZZ127_1273 [Planctomycetota bacterium]|jgi:hypothetical protein